MPIVEAVGVAVRSKNKDLSKRIEAAMSAAVLQALADGISDPAKMKEYMQAARERAKRDYFAAQAAAAAE